MASLYGLCSQNWHLSVWVYIYYGLSNLYMYHIGLDWIRAVVAVAPPPGLDSDKHYCWISGLAALTFGKKITFFFLWEAFCGLEYAEIASASDLTGEAHDAPPDFASDPTGGAQNALPDPIVDWGGDTLPQTPPHSAPSAPRSSRCPLHIIFGYATEINWNYGRRMIVSSHNSCNCQ